MTGLTMLPKLMGTDFELGNFLVGGDSPVGTGGAAARALLGAIEGYPLPRAAGAYAPGICSCGCGVPLAAGVGYSTFRGQWEGRPLVPSVVPRLLAPWSAPAVRVNPQDIGRKYLVNGGCAYIDLDHCELCSPETLSAFDQVACQHAMLRIAQRALAAANGRQPPGRRIQALFNNSDGLGNSYGSHTNFLITRETWDQMFNTKLQLLLYLAAFQASSIVFTGQGKVGSENGAPDVGFQLSQRADFLETLAGPQTTMRRPIVNSRDETLCGQFRRDADAATDQMARLHVIFFDATFCHVATLLKFGTMQIVLAMIEAGRANLRLILDDPLRAVREWSHDPSLGARARLVDGSLVTAVELQRRFFEDARRFVKTGGCDGIVPRASEILANWGGVLSRLGSGDTDALTGQLDWVLKRAILRQAMTRRPGLGWRSPEVKHLDLLYASLDPHEGLYWAYEQEGIVQRLVSSEAIDGFTERPPEDTRAWTRGALLRHAGGDHVVDANWDAVRVTTRNDGRWQAPLTVGLANPLAWTRADCESAFEGASDLASIVSRLEAYGAGLACGGGRPDRRGPAALAYGQGHQRQH